MRIPRFPARPPVRRLSAQITVVLAVYAAVVTAMVAVLRAVGWSITAWVTVSAVGIAATAWIIECLTGAYTDLAHPIGESPWGDKPSRTWLPMCSDDDHAALYAQGAVLCPGCWAPLNPTPGPHAGPHDPTAGPR